MKDLKCNTPSNKRTATTSKLHHSFHLHLNIYIPLRPTSTAPTVMITISKQLSFFLLISFGCLTGAIEKFSVSKINKLAKEQSQSQHIIQTEAKEGLEEKEDDTWDVQELYVTQRLDHFSSHSNDNDNDNTVPYSFSQRYFYTTRYLQPETLPKPTNPLRGATAATKNHDNNNYNNSTSETYAFICVGGEGPSLTKTSLTNSPHCSGDMLALATILSSERNANVHVFALEHRYYGKSYPKFNNNTSPVSNDNLQYLSSHQALADLAHFVQYARDSTSDAFRQIDNQVKFVTFGASYPGMLAAWSRLKYPHLIHAAVSNSAPLQVTLDFTTYLDVYAKALSNPMVGGSQECVDIIQEAHEDIVQKLTGPDIRRYDVEYVAELFNICNGADALEEEKNVKHFLGDGMVFFDVQGNDPNCQEDLCNIQKFCGNITASASAGARDESGLSLSAAEILARLSIEMEGEGQCKDISWEGMIDFLSSEKAQAGGTRSWLWQTCTEVGFYQTCTVNSTCPFARGLHVLDDDLEICQRAFGIDPEMVRGNVEDTLNEYGGWDIASSRILSVNGDIDPWSAKSYSNSGRTDIELPSYWSIGASHHYWTHEVKGSDGFGIMRTREIIYDWVMNVLEDGTTETLLTTDDSLVNVDVSASVV